MPGRYRHALAADRKTIGGDDGFEFRNSAEMQRRHVFEEIAERRL